METVIHELLAPVSRRLGTLVGGALSGLGLASDDVSAVAAGAVALLGIAVDLGILYLRNRKVR